MESLYRRKETKDVSAENKEQQERNEAQCEL